MQTTNRAHPIWTEEHSTLQATSRARGPENIYTHTSIIRYLGQFCRDPDAKTWPVLLARETALVLRRGLSLSCFWLTKGSPIAPSALFSSPLLLPLPSLSFFPPFSFFLTMEAQRCPTEAYSESSSTAPSQAPPHALCAADLQWRPERQTERRGALWLVLR